jgi:hypothetical protein
MRGVWSTAQRGLMTRARRTAATLTCLLALTTGLTACGDSPAVCDDVDALRASVDNLQSASLGENGLEAITTELQTMRSEIDQLSQDAQDEYAEQISQVRSRATELREGVETTAEAPSAAGLADVRGDLSALGTAVQELGSAVADSC